MYELIELTLSDRFAEVFKTVLAKNKTRTLVQDGYYKLVYLKPPNVTVFPLNTKGIALKIVEEVTSNSWTVARHMKPQVISDDLLSLFDGLVVDELRAGQSASLIMPSWYLERVSYGLHEPSEVVYLVRDMFSHGYSFDDVTGVFTSLCRRKGLPRVFLSEAKKIYQGG